MKKVEQVYSSKQEDTNVYYPSVGGEIYNRCVDKIAKLEAELEARKSGKLTMLLLHELKHLGWGSPEQLQQAREENKRLRKIIDTCRYCKWEEAEGDDALTSPDATWEELGKGFIEQEPDWTGDT